MGRQIRKFAILSVLGACGLVGWNYFTLQKQAAQTISSDPRNAGIELFAHYQWFLNPRVIAFDLRNVSSNNSPLDVSRTLLQFSERLKAKSFDRVVLSFKGEPRFVLRGDYFHTLGAEYNFQNPVYTLRTLPENVYNIDGSPAFGAWTGGWLGVMGKQMEDLNDFHKRWYLADVARGS